MHFVMVFLDGVGLGREDANPIFAARTPILDSLLGGHHLWGKPLISHGCTKLCPLDASLGVPGVPQSATGQTTLWTGVNAAKVLGYHLNAYPNDILQELIAAKSIFRQLTERGKSAMFANCFTAAYDQAVAAGKRRHTASTLSALAGGVKLRRVPDLLAGRAVYQDMTNQILRELGENVPLYTAAQAGGHLAQLAQDYDFTLYEFFQTDIKGHKQVWDQAVGLIEQIDSFIGGFVEAAAGKDVALLVTSDHGNIEDFTVKGHTHNPVPALAWSDRRLTWPQWVKLEDVTPGIVNLLT